MSIKLKTIFTRLKSFWPFALILLLVIAFYRPFFTKQLLPIPADIIPGMYYPWLDYKYPEFPNNIPVKNHLPSDVVSLTYPLRFLSINLLKSGHWPLWNPYILSGTPLLANFQSAALYPLNLLYFLINNFSFVWSIQVMCQPLLGLIFSYLFLRSFSLIRPAALFGAMVWAFGSFFTLWGQYNTVVHAILYLPLALLALKNIHNNLLWGLGFTAALSFSILAGNPPMSLILCLACIVFLLCLYHLRLTSFLRPLLFGLLGLGIALPQLLPGIVNSGLSVRQSDTVAADNLIKFVHPRQLITLVSPDFFGNPTTLNHWAPGLYDNLTIFVGVIPLTLFLLALYHLPLKQNITPLFRFGLIMVAGTLILMIKNPISQLVGSLPFMGLSAMVMSRFFALTGLGIAIISSLFLDYLITSAPKSAFRPFPFLLISILLLVPALTVLPVHAVFKYRTQLFHLPDPTLADMSVVIRNTLTSLRNSFLPILIFIAGFLLLTFRRYLNPKLLYLAIFGLTFFDLSRFFAKYNSFTPSKYLYPPSPTISYLQNHSQRFLREGGELLPSNMWLPYGLSASSGYDTLHSARYNGFISLVNGGSLTNLTNRYLEINNLSSPLLDFLGISHLVALKRTDGKVDPQGQLHYKTDLKKWQPVFEDKSTVILANRRFQPLFFPVSRYLVSSDVSKTNQLLAFTDLSREVILESDPKLTLSSALPEISQLKTSPQESTFSTKSSSSSLIVTSQSYDPGWRLYIDKLPTPIYIANYSFMALPVPPGNHQVQMVYGPSSFYFSLIIFKISLLISLAILLVYLFNLKIKLRRLG